jgi:hypothetical protein
LGILNRIRYWRRLKADFVASSAADVPAQLPTRHAVIVGTERHPKWLVFDCPCRRAHRVMLNLDPSHTPRWRVSATYPLTLQPSVDERSAVGHCHYVVHEGRVRWIDRTDHK